MSDTSYVFNKSVLWPISILLADQKFIVSACEANHNFLHSTVSNASLLAATSVDPENVKIMSNWHR